MNSNDFLAFLEFEFGHSSVVALTFKRLFLLALLDRHCLHVVFLPGTDPERCHLLRANRKLSAKLGPGTQQRRLRSILKLNLQAVDSDAHTRLDARDDPVFEVGGAE